MNYLKSVIQTDELFDLLTCADNDAVGFFKKQGFNDKAIHMDPKRWQGRIKDYDKITLVHCHIYPEVDYMNFQLASARQLAFLESHLGKRVYPALFNEQDIWRPYKHAPTYLSLPLTDVMALSTFDDSSAPEKLILDNYIAEVEKLRWRMLHLLRLLQADDKFSEIFQKPVTEAIAPGYFETITKPMDFQTIERRLLRFNDYYKSPAVFWADMQQMVENCKQFNSQDTMYYKAAANLWKEFNKLYSTEFGEELGR
jgi:histone acetyltransferase